MDRPAGAVVLTAGRALAIGIDAAEPALVRSLLDAGALPVMNRVLGAGSWSRIESPAHIGSGAVWPTFFTGTGADEHGVHSEWSWCPERMSLRPYDSSVLEPFWRSWASAGLLDIPFAPFGCVTRGFEISEWGAHDPLEGRTRVTPAMELPEHPFSAHRSDLASCIEGVKLRGRLGARLLRETRPDLAVIVFTELHHAAHRFWEDREAMAEILGEVDTQIGTIIDACEEDCPLLLFSLHGMREARGMASLLESFLIAQGFAVEPAWSALSLIAAAKRRTPRALKNLYYRTMPRSATVRLAQPTMLPAYDWSRTRAFSLPTDQHGWIRINLRGREASGIVDARDFDGLCRDLESALRATMLVEDVIRTPPDSRLPDLVVHWSAAAESPLASGKVLTGQHAPDGFLIACGVRAPEVVQARDLHRLLRG